MQGIRVYLMPGGSVGCDDADVRSPDEMGRYGFPTGELTRDEVNAAVRRSLDLMTIGDPAVTVPALSAAYSTRCTEPGLDGGARVTQARSHGYPVSA